MAKATITNCETGATKTIEIELQIGGHRAEILHGGLDLFEKVGEWQPLNVGGVEFDLKVGATILRRCRITGMGSTTTIDFLDRE